MHEDWRLLRTLPLPGALNMALDEVLLGAVAGGRSKPVLRLYRWAPPAVTIGYAQLSTDVNLQNCRNLGYEVVRRQTGGRAVLHENDCTYAVIARTGAVFSDTVIDSYRVIAGVLQQALVSLGITVVVAEGRRRGHQPGICFTAPGYGELLCRGCKVAGSSQKRQGQAFLQHGSIPVDLDLDRLWQILGRANHPLKAGTGDLARSIGWLNRFLTLPVSIAEVENAVIAAFASALPVCLLADEPTTAEWQAARQLATEKYENEVWTLRSDPAHPSSIRSS